jgi:hypothetical protein
VPEPYDFFAPPRTGPAPGPVSPKHTEADAVAPEADPYAPPQNPEPWMTSPGTAPDLRFGPAAGSNPQFGPVPGAPTDARFGPAADSRFGGIAVPPQQFGAAGDPYGAPPPLAAAGPYGGPPQFGPVGPGFAGGGYYDPRSHAVPGIRPGTITAASVMLFVQAAFILLVGLILFVGAVGLSGAAEGNGVLSGIVWFVALLYLALGGLFVLLGVKILNGRAWAAITVVVLNGLGILASLGDLRTGATYESSSNGAYQAGVSLTPVLSIVWAVTVIVLLALPKSRAWLRH